MISPSTSKLIYEKYNSLPEIVLKLDPSNVAQIFKCTKNPFAFFPTVGLFSIEFSLGYCNSMHCSKKNLDNKKLKNKWKQT